MNLLKTRLHSRMHVIRVLYELLRQLQDSHNKLLSQQRRFNVEVQTVIGKVGDKQSEAIPYYKVVSGDLENEFIDRTC